MKKTILLLIILIMLSGCSITRIDNYNHEQIVDYVLSLDIKNYNMIGKGYKYYAPKGVVRVKANEYNDVLRKNNNIYYLYVDVISYFYKTKEEYKVNNDAFYSAIINKDDKSGYIEITEKESKLYVKMMYNYAKIEAYVETNELEDALLDMSYILKSVKFNDTLLTKMYKEGKYNSKDEVYKLFQNKEKEGNFLEYVEEYDKYEEQEEVPEELIIEEAKTTTTSKENEEVTSSSN